MPIIDVQLVLDADAGASAGLASVLADDLGRLLHAAPGRLWLRLHLLPASQYAENAVSIADQDLPVFVAVLHARLPEAGELATQAEAIARVVAAAVGRSPERVHVEYAPAGVGRVAFGGRLVG